MIRWDTLREANTIHERILNEQTTRTEKGSLLALEFTSAIGEGREIREVKR